MKNAFIDRNMFGYFTLGDEDGFHRPKHLWILHFGRLRWLSSTETCSDTSFRSIKMAFIDRNMFGYFISVDEHGFHRPKHVRILHFGR
jgi:hypothetical protein